MFTRKTWQEEFKFKSLCVYADLEVMILESKAREQNDVLKLKGGEMRAVDDM